VKQTAIEKKAPNSLKETSQYALAFGVIALMFYVIGFPVFILFFFGVLAFFIWKAFSTENRDSTRRIFEFYLSANEILREDDRRWYGFEIQETISRGESILKSMSSAPPLVHYCLGALYQKIGDHGAAAKHLGYVVEDGTADELSIVFPTKELREYVRILRKIERSPAEAPLTSSAVRALERGRKNKAKTLLDESRSLATDESKMLESVHADESAGASVNDNEDHGPLKPLSVVDEVESHDAEQGITYRFADFTKSKRRKKAEAAPPDRKTISEVLHDIYDENVQ
jgi:hypothetical protein